MRALARIISIYLSHKDLLKMSERHYYVLKLEMRVNHARYFSFNINGNDHWASQRA